jgi:hypothetical protein
MSTHLTPAGLKKVFKLTYDDTAAAMHATYKKAEAVNYLSIKNKILSDALQNITPSTEEIGLLPANNRIKIRTHVEPGSGAWPRVFSLTCHSPLKDALERGHPCGQRL